VEKLVRLSASMLTDRISTNGRLSCRNTQGGIAFCNNVVLLGDTDNDNNTKLFL
jgi:hypothetical protein